MILDGPTGTQLIARGYRPREELWTALAAEEASDLLRAIHQDYVRAGAEVLTANTFRTTPYAARETGLPIDRMHRLCDASVALARAAGPRLVAGSLAPLADCYRPELTPPQEVLLAAHAEAAAWLVAAGCDVVLCETHGTTREALAAVQTAKAAGAVRVWASFILAEDGRHLLGGDLLIEAARVCLLAGAGAIGVNCVHADVIDRALPLLVPLARAHGAGVITYANSARMHFAEGGPVWEPDPRPVAEQAVEYGQRAVAWARAGATIIGSCCGTTPEHIRAVTRGEWSASG